MPLKTQPTHSSKTSSGMRVQLSTIAWWLATLGWAALIFYLSTPPFGAHRSVPILARLLAFFDLSLSDTTLHVLDSFIRTLAHLTEYAVLALLLYRSCRGRTGPGWSARLAFWCVGIAALYAVTDEYHQSFSSTRGASALDCVLDTVGAALGMLVAYFWARVSRRRTNTKSLQQSAVSFQPLPSARDGNPVERAFDGLTPTSGA
jgi:VanZ family protein